MLTTQKFLSDEESAALLATLNKYKNRDTLMLYILYQYGMRSGELLALRKCDINLAGPSILIKGSKGSRDREFPVELNIFRRLLAEMEKCKADTDRVFPLTYGGLRWHWHNYRPCKKRIHSLRHTRAMITFKKSDDIFLVQAILGHANINNTMIYLNFVYGQKQFKEALFG